MSFTPEFGVNPSLSRPGDDSHSSTTAPTTEPSNVLPVIDRSKFHFYSSLKQVVHLLDTPSSAKEINSILSQLGTQFDHAHAYIDTLEGIQLNGHQQREMYREKTEALKTKQKFAEKVIKAQEELVNTPPPPQQTEVLGLEGMSSSQS